MKENQMNLEQMCAMINEMHKELETLKNALLEKALVAEDAGPPARCSMRV